MDPLADVFDLTRVSCGVMAQLIAHEPWGVTIDLVPGAAFHAVVAGGCWLRLPGRAPHHLMPGDVVLLPTNTPHELVSSVDARPDELMRFETDVPRTPEGDMVIQGPGAGTRLLCAAYDYDHEVAHPMMSQLPPVLYVPAGMPGDDGAVAATLRLLAFELGGRPPGSRAAVGRLIDVLLIHAMRVWLRMQEDDATEGWLLALRDPVIARAMNTIHQRPREPWTIESLAREVSVSRATLARRFAHLVGETPPEYLTRWRMDLAAQRSARHRRHRRHDRGRRRLPLRILILPRVHPPPRARPRPLPAPRPRRGARDRLEARRGRNSDDAPKPRPSRAQSGLLPFSALRVSSRVGTLTRAVPAFAPARASRCRDRQTRYARDPRLSPAITFVSGAASPGASASATREARSQRHESRCRHAGRRASAFAAKKSRV